LKAMTRDFERKIIQRLLEAHGQNQQQVARLLGVSRMSLWRKLQGAGGQ